MINNFTPISLKEQLFLAVLHSDMAVSGSPGMATQEGTSGSMFHLRPFSFEAPSEQTKTEIVYHLQRLLRDSGRVLLEDNKDQKYVLAAGL